VGYIDNSTLAGNSATKSAPAGAGGGYFIIKNSWGTCSGDVGYYYMPVDYLKVHATHVWVVASVTH
jgi:C1A family cysteine protease